MSTLFSFAFSSYLTIPFLHGGFAEMVWYKKVRRKSFASLSLWWELEELACFDPYKLFTGPCTAPSTMTQGFLRGFTGTAGIQRLVNEVWIAGSQIELEIAPAFLNCSRTNKHE